MAHLKHVACNLELDVVVRVNDDGSKTIEYVEIIDGVVKAGLLDGEAALLLEKYDFLDTDIIFDAIDGVVRGDEEFFTFTATPDKGNN